MFDGVRIRLNRGVWKRAAWADLLMGFRVAGYCGYSPWSQAAGIHQQLNELPDQRQAQGDSCERPSEIQMLKRTSEGPHSFYGASLIAGIVPARIVPEAAYRPLRQGLCGNYLQTDGVLRFYPGTQLTAGSAGRGEKYARWRTCRGRLPAGKPISDFRPVLTPFCTESACQVVCFIPLRDACAVDHGSDWHQEKPAIFEQSGPRQHHQRA